MQSPRHSHQVVQCTHAAPKGGTCASGSGLVCLCASVSSDAQASMLEASVMWMIAAHDGKHSLLKAMLCVSSLSGD